MGVRWYKKIIISRVKNAGLSAEVVDENISLQAQVHHKDNNIRFKHHHQ